MSSARVTCNVNDFYSVLMDFVSENVDDNEQAIQRNVKEAGEHAEKELQGYDGPYATGKYAKGWKSDFRTGEYGHATATVHNTSQPSLTHLIEKGHELFVHGRDTGRRTRANPHIETAYENAADILLGGGVE